MNFPFYIAKRYLFSKKKRNIINIISAISVAGIAIGTMALIIVLSVFNGFEDLVISLFNSFDPDIKITAAEGKIIDTSTFPKDKISKVNGVIHYAEVLEENALFQYENKQVVGKVKGVSSNYTELAKLDSMIIDGDFIFTQNNSNYAVVGQGVAYTLGLRLSDQFNPISVFMPKRGKVSSMNPEKAFNRQNIMASGVFAIQQDFDNEYVLVPLPFVQSLLDYDNEISAIEIEVDDSFDLENIQQEMQLALGADFKVQTRFQQHEFLYKIMKSEKLAVFVILGFILLISIFNVVGSITMLIIDKQKDISVLWSMGAEKTMIRKIFFIEGLLISLFGASIGLFLGFLFCWVQIQFGLIQIEGAESFVVSAYPVVLELMDFVYVFLTVLALLQRGYLVSKEKE